VVLSDEVLDQNVVIARSDEWSQMKKLKFQGNWNGKCRRRCGSLGPMKVGLVGKPSIGHPGAEQALGSGITDHAVEIEK
jgi:hypothetical protein